MQYSGEGRQLTQDTFDTSTAAGGSVAPAPVGAAGCPVAPGGYDEPPQPLGPDSLTWKYFGQWTGMLQGPWAGSMQNMHPQLGAAVQQHSIFFRERMPRLYRSVYPIGGVVFDGDRAPTTGLRSATTTSASRAWTIRAAATAR